MSRAIHLDRSETRSYNATSLLFSGFLQLFAQIQLLLLFQPPQGRGRLSSVLLQRMPRSIGLSTYFLYEEILDGVMMAAHLFIYFQHPARRPAFSLYFEDFHLLAPCLSLMFT